MEESRRKPTTERGIVVEQNTYIGVLDTDFGRGVRKFLPNLLAPILKSLFLKPGKSRPLNNKSHRVFIGRVDLKRPVIIINRWALYTSGWGSWGINSGKGHGPIQMSLKWIGTQPLKIETEGYFSGNSWWSSGRVRITPPTAPFIIINNLPFDTVTPTKTHNTCQWIWIGGTNWQLARALLKK
jgi:hypothetical protein